MEKRKYRVSFDIEALSEDEPMLIEDVPLTKLNIHYQLMHDYSAKYRGHYHAGLAKLSNIKIKKIR